MTNHEWALALRRLCHVRHNGQVEIPEAIPRGLGTAQIYAALFDAVLDGRPLIRFSRDFCNDAEIPESDTGPATAGDQFDDSRATQVPNNGRPAWERMEEIVKADHLLKPLVTRLYATDDYVDWLITLPQGRTWQDVQAKGGEWLDHQLGLTTTYDCAVCCRIEAEAVERIIQPLRLRGDDRYVKDTRGEGDEYCWECGHVAPRGQFTASGYPNPACPNPNNWDD
ncbi:MAG: hypothetical protein Q8P82_00935 [bacterium]|nr:hypothetical protein [bacterium]